MMPYEVERLVDLYDGTLNHVTLYSSDVVRSKAFYQRLTGLPIQAEDKESCEFRLESGFLGIYAPDAGQRPGFNYKR